jgi:aminoglycoside 6'-N-acetyltransferase I
MDIRIREMLPADANEWLRMRLALWPDEPAAHADDIRGYFAGDRHEPEYVLVAVDEAGAAIGFAELSIRNIVDGCDTDRVAYLEGWYVDPDARRAGVGRALVAAAEERAVREGCTEFGSDALVDNHISHAAHRALGFEEVARVATFRKDLVRRQTSPVTSDPSR